MPFPEGFVWGAAASSYQIEGAADEDGRGLSVWDVFCRRPGAVLAGQNGAVAADHYHRYREDVALMRAIGLHAYRLSVAWPRVLPAGVGKPNEAGLAFYDALIDALLAAGITPYVTLFHWDFPYELYCRGGWLNPDAPDWFAEYAGLLARRLGDRVMHWMTFNEPQVVAAVGHFWGVHAPGDKLQRGQVAQIMHHLLLAHGKAVQAIRANSPSAQVGMALSGPLALPAGHTPADVEAARLETFSIEQPDLLSFPIWLDPTLRGVYPPELLAWLGADAPTVGPNDLRTICQPLDFLGLNIYQGETVRMGAGGKPEKAPLPPGQPITLNHWPVTPEALYWGPRFLWECYRLPVVIAENGLSSMDWPAPDGQVHDPQRIDFLRQYLRCLAQVIAEGVDVRGYFQWSLLDNFEWQDGYSQRFGLIHVDYATQRRTLKDSAHWYRELIATNGAALFERLELPALRLEA